MKKAGSAFRIRKKVSRRTKLAISGVSIIIIIIAALVLLSAIVPSFIFTFGGRLSFETPKGFSVGAMYSFAENQKSSELSVSADDYSPPYPDNRDISFKYPQITILGDSSGNDGQLLESMDFTLKNPAANGLVQIWNLTATINNLLNRTIEHNNMTYLSFKTARSVINGLNCITWNYSFKNGVAVIHGLEAFIPDEQTLYRICLFVPEKNYGDQALAAFNDMVDSVSVK